MANPFCYPTRTEGSGGSVIPSGTGFVYQNPPGTFSSTTSISGAALSDGSVTNAKLQYSSITLTQPAAGLTVTSSVALGGTATFALADDLAALEGLSSTGFAVRSGTSTWVQRSLDVGSGLSIGNSDGVSGNPTISLGTELAGLAGLATTGLVQRTGAGTYSTTTAPAISGASITAGTIPVASLFSSSISFAQPAAGLTITSSAALGGTATFALADDLAALEALASTGLAARTAANTWAQRSIAVGTGLSVSNGNGVSGNPTVSLGTELAGVAALATIGFVQRTGAGTYSTTSLINLNTDTTGVTPTAKGGTNLSSFTAGGLLYASDTTTISLLVPGSANQVLTSNGTGPAYQTLPTATTGAASLSTAQYDITTSGAYEDVGLSVTLPSAGTYLLQANVRTFVQTSASPPGYITIKLYNSTDAADVTNSERFGAVDYTNNGATCTTTISEVVTVAASKTIKVYAKRNSGPTFTNSGVASSSDGRSRLTYLKLSN